MDDLVEAVREAAGLRAHAHAAAALRAVMVPLGAMIPHHRREMIAAALSPPADDALRELPYDATRGAQWLAETVANEEHVRTSFGLEHVEAVLGVVRDALPADVWGVLFGELPEDVRALVPPRRGSEPPPRAPKRAPGQAHRLADGRPGSMHPIAESAADRGHSHSVARADDPHGDTKLSEGKGLTQQREHESLAEAAPGPARTIASTRGED